MELTAVVERICAQVDWCDSRRLHSALQLAVEIASEGREGAPVGTLFTIERPQAVLATSRSLILEPLSGHAPRGNASL